jgi:HD-GYP domain-containing protein (c-di-GMP phosphodiesterase class II)
VRVVTDPAVDALSGAVEAADTREQAALVGTVEALAALVDARDAYTGQHAQLVAALSRHLALDLGLDASGAEWVSRAAQLHDVGKVGVPDAVLQKAGGLDEAEWALIRQHPVVGADIVSRVPALRVLVPAIRGHHERWDGRGYPDGMAGPAIPLAARILSVADAYDAMMRDRPYRHALNPQDALMEIRRGAGSQFDPGVVDALERIIAREAEAQVQATG